MPLMVVVGDEDFPCLDGSLFLKRTAPTAALLVVPRRAIPSPARSRRPSTRRSPTVLLIRRRPARVLRAVRAPAPRSGVGGHRRVGRGPHHDRARPRPRVTGVRRGEAARAARADGRGPRALLHHRVVGVGERAARVALGSPPGGARAQRQPDQRGGAPRRAHRRRRPVPRHLRLGDHRRAALHSRGGAHRGRARRGDAEAPGRLLHGRDDEGLRGRVPRRRRTAAAVARHAGRQLLRGLRELRLRHHRRRAAPRGAAGRDGVARQARDRDAADRGVGAQGVLRVRAHLLRAARLDPRGQPHPGVAPQDGRDPLARGARGGRRGDRGARLGQPRGRRLLQGLRDHRATTA